jgi:hypothetical protein
MMLEVLQKLLRSGELTPPELNQANRDRFGLPQFVVREAVASDRVVSFSEAEWQRRLLKRRQERLLS